MFFEVGVQQCLANGLTSLQSNDGGMGAWEHYSAMEEAGTLPLRIFLTVNIDDITPGGSDSGGGIGGLGGGAAKAPPAGSTTPGGLVKCERVKLFGDGSLGAETAAIRGAYNSEDGQEQPAAAPEEGVLIQPDDELAAKMVEAKRQGYRLEIHAIGDRAAASVLDGLEAAGVTPQDRAVITHCQLLGADLIARMAKLKCIANIQPQFVVTDAPFARARVPARIQEHAYVWKTLLEKGIPCAGGSDAPVEAPTPLIGMHDAIFRHGVGADPATAYKPEQALSFAEALALYTQGAETTLSPRLY
jgi:predicted amidohydrolase YtcJ